MKTLDKILNNGWHKHFPIGGLVITVLLFLATFSESLRYVEELLVCFSIAAMGYYAFDNHGLITYFINLKTHQARYAQVIDDLRSDDEAYMYHTWNAGRRISNIVNVFLK